MPWGFLVTGVDAHGYCPGNLWGLKVLETTDLCWKVVWWEAKKSKGLWAAWWKISSRDSLHVMVSSKPSAEQGSWALDWGPALGECKDVLVGDKQVHRWLQEGVARQSALWMEAGSFTCPSVRRGSPDETLESYPSPAKFSLLGPADRLRLNALLIWIHHPCYIPGKLLFLFLASKCSFLYHFIWVPCLPITRKEAEGQGAGRWLHAESLPGGFRARLPWWSSG